MKTKSENINAFPNPSMPNAEPGMSLRDYFAAAALQGMAANPNEWNSDDDIFVKSYKWADSMLLQRTKG